MECNKFYVLRIIPCADCGCATDADQASGYSPAPEPDTDGTRNGPIRPTPDVPLKARRTGSLGEVSNE